MMKIGVLIPAFNEASQIGQVVKSVKFHGFLPIVVDDGSTDGTADIAESSGANVIRHAQNMGKGASLKTGIKHILDEGYDAVLIMDGDGQHSAGDIQAFIDSSSKDKNILVVGNRMNHTRNMPIDRKITNMFMSFILSLVCRQKIPDSQCGFRLIKRDLLKKINIQSNRFEVESELLVKACRAGAKIRSVPIETLYGEEASQINPFCDTFRFIIFLLKTFFTK